MKRQKSNGDKTAKRSYTSVALQGGKRLEETRPLWIIIVICFLLGMMDMILLRDSIQRVMGQNSSLASFMALVLATVANFAAFLWGRAKGENSDGSKSKVGARSCFLTWCGVGGVYMLFRVAEIFQDVFVNGDMSRLLGEIVNIIMLAILFVSTGLTICECAERIFDVGANTCREAKKKFEEMHKRLPKCMGEFSRNVNQLQSYYKNYDYLNQQAAEIYRSIAKYEKSVMADIENRILTAYAEVDPMDLHKVKQLVLSDNVGLFEREK